MGYYTIRLDPDASKICTIIFLWGKYSYKRLPMGIAGLWECLTAVCKALSLANAKGKGTDGLVIKS
jgi:hypothetical protein